LKNSASELAGQSLGFAARRAHRAFDRALQRRLAPHGIATGQWYYLRALWEEDGLTQRALSERTGVAENTTTAMIAAMLADGLVTRARAADDKRKWVITLTPRARALRDELLPLAAEVNALAAGGLAEADQARFLTAIAAMTANLLADEPEVVGG